VGEEYGEARKGGVKGATGVPEKERKAVERLGKEGSMTCPEAP